MPSSTVPNSRDTRALAWLLFALLLLGLIAYWLPWVDHQAAALKLSGQDLGEFVKFLPQIRRGQMRFPRQVFYLPPLVGALSLVLVSTQQYLAYPRWARTGMLVLAVLALPGLLPPVWGHPRDLFNAEFRLQGIALVFGLLFVLSHGLWKQVPLHVTGWVLGALAFSALVPTQWAFWTIRPRIWQAYNTPTIHLGWGLALSIAAWAGVLCCSAAVIWRTRPHAGQTTTGIDT